METKKIFLPNNLEELGDLTLEQFPQVSITHVLHLLEREIDRQSSKINATIHSCKSEPDSRLYTVLIRKKSPVLGGTPALLRFLVPKEVDNFLHSEAQRHLDEAYTWRMVSKYSAQQDNIFEYNFSIQQRLHPYCKNQYNFPFPDQASWDKFSDWLLEFRPDFWPFTPDIGEEADYFPKRRERAMYGQ